jgi:hypothetical protein
MKNSLCNSVSSVVKKLLEYGEDGTPVYVNELTALNQELRNLCADLLLQKGESPEEEAKYLLLCSKVTIPCCLISPLRMNRLFKNYWIVQ